MPVLRFPGETFLRHCRRRDAAQGPVRFQQAGDGDQPLNRATPLRHPGFGIRLRLLADEVIPPPPAAYFNDYANVVSTGTAAQLDKTLEDFERQSSDQIVVAVFPKMQSDSSIEDYTVRVARSWQVGQKNKNNGAVLFVFVQDHKMFLQVGYGLEGVLPDALCKRIIDEQISPRFKAGDFDGGLTAGVQESSRRRRVNTREPGQRWRNIFLITN